MTVRAWGRRIRVLGVLAGIELVVAAALVATSAEGSAAVNTPMPPCPATGIGIAGAQPVDRGVLKVSHLSGGRAGAADRWEMRYDVWACNKKASAYSLKSVRITHYKNDSILRTFTTHAANSPSFPAGAGQTLFMIRDGKTWLYPLPTKIQITLMFGLTTTTTPSVTLTRTYPVADHLTPGPNGAFFFPLRPDTLPAELGGENFYYDSHHKDFNHQRFAYDIGGTWWDSAANEWTSYLPESDHTKKESLLIWGEPVYAMSEGEVILCNRGAKDNEPQYVDGLSTGPKPTGKYKGGNQLWIRTGSETQLYAHLQQFSIPTSLCPHTEDQTYKVGNPFNDPASEPQYHVQAGEFLGYAGNSGTGTSGPHLHIHSIRGLPSEWGGSETGWDSDGRPMRFVNVHLQTRPSAHDAVEEDWIHIGSAKVVPYNTLIVPNTCSFDPSELATHTEVARSGALDCTDDMLNAMRQVGLRPVALDATRDGTMATGDERFTVVARQNDGTEWAVFTDMDATRLQLRHDAYTAQGYHYLQFESYGVHNAIRYAAIFVKGQPSPPEYVNPDMTEAQFTSTFNTKTAEGYRMVNISTVSLNGVLHYAGYWVYAPVGAYVVKTVPAADFKTETDNQSAAGNTLVFANSFDHNGVTYLSGIWYGATKASTYFHTAVPFDVFPNWESEQKLAGRFLRVVAQRTPQDGTVVAVWRAAPNTVLAPTGPTGTTTARTATFSFTANDPLATFECKLDQTAWVSCTSTRNYRGLTLGAHTFSVRARDMQGVRDATPAVRSWTVV